MREILHDKKKMPVRGGRGIASHLHGVFILLILVVVVLNPLSIGVLAEEDPENDSELTVVEILLHLYDSTRGLRWTNRSKWLQEEDDFCSWHGITCFVDDPSDPLDADKRRVGYVREIDLSNNHLVGSLPSQIYDLPFLSSLQLKDNPDLTVSLEHMEAAQFLRHFNLENTRVDLMEGFWNSTSSLTQLHLTNSQIQGTLPKSLFGLTSLTGLYANHNSFTGSIPTEIGLLTNLKEVFMIRNDLTGQIPTEVGLLTAAKVLAFAGNSFHGSIPTEFGNCENLEILALNRDPNKIGGKDGLTGSLPALDKLEYLTEFYTGHHQLQGSIPDNFLQSAPKDEIIKVDLSNNQLTGAIPESLIELSRLNMLVVNNQISVVSDKICDNIPGWLGGHVQELGCNAFLCPPNTYSFSGRKTRTANCEPCPGAKFYGSVKCTAPDEPEANGGTSDIPQDINPRQVLATMYNRMGGRFWKQDDGWLDPSVHECDWFGIECHQKEIKGIVLKANGLIGTIPEEVFALPALRGMNLNSNQITVPFSSIARSRTLEFIDLANTGLLSLEGIDKLALTNIKRIKLGSNKLRGEIPQDLFLLTQLKEINLSHNKFTGPIPVDIGQLTDLERLQIFSNELTGSLPTELGRLTKLWQLTMSENAFTGKIPTQIELLTALRMLEIHQTTTDKGLSGPLPSFQAATQLANVNLASNQLTGTLPANFLASTQETASGIEVHLADNNLRGELPSGWADRFQDLTIDLTGNQLTGIASEACNKEDWNGGTVGQFKCAAILCPAGTYNEVGRRTDQDSVCRACENGGQFLGARQCNGGADSTEISILKEFYYSTGGTGWKNSQGWIKSNNYCRDWVGVTCDVEGMVTQISLKNNGLSGSPPASVFQLQELEALDLQFNRINFKFDGIENAIKLESLYLSGTGLTSIDGIGNATSLKVVHLTDNDLTSSLPSEIFQLTNLEELFLNYNRLSGRIPNQISRLTNLEQLYLFNNRISGQIPASIGALKQLKVLALTENALSGTLPPELEDLKSLELLAIQREETSADKSEPDDKPSVGSGIRGPLLSFNSQPNLREIYLGSNSLTGTIPFNFLDGVSNKSSNIVVDLIANDLKGAIPPSLTQFDKLTIYLSGNRISSIADGLCLKDGWMKGKVAQYQCNAILCPPGTFSKYGRQHDENSVCDSCPIGGTAPYYGSSECLSEEDSKTLGEQTILAEFYSETDGENWKVNTNWMNKDASICTWYGVTCSSADEESVVSLHLSQNGLNGTIPANLMKLPNLSEINFSGNKIMLEFANVDAATALEYLNLDDTGATSLGGIDSAAPNLKLLHAINNNFQFFPPEIFQLTHLEVLYLSGNEFGGQMPPATRLLKNLVFLTCSDCGFTGPIPSWIGQFPKLEYLQLDQNSLTGSLPTELLSLSTLKHLDLSDQITRGGGDGLNGTLLDFAGIANLRELLLSRNGLSGNIPSTFLKGVNNEKVITVKLRDNKLEGSIPTELAAIQKMDIDLANNKIDNIPEAICSSPWNGGSSGCDHILCAKGTFNLEGRETESMSCKACPDTDTALYVGSTSCGENLEREVLKNLFVDTSGPNWRVQDGWLTDNDLCDWFGITCHTEGDKKGFVKSIRLPENGLSGTIPSFIFELQFMETLEVRRNKISLSFEGIENADALETLHLSQTLVTDVKNISKASNLKAIHLTSNEIVGNVPDEIFSIEKLERLYLNYNKLSGTLSTTVGNLVNLKELYLFSNALSGTIPTEIGSLKALEVLGLGENQFIGSLPPQLNSLNKIQILSLQRERGLDEAGSDSGVGSFGDGIVGPLLSFDALPDLRELYLGGNSLKGTIPSDFLVGIKDITEPIKVDLTLNELEGSVPGVLARFQDLRIFLAGNQISTVPDAVCSKVNWMNGLIGDSCNAFLCPPGTFNKYGRKINKDIVCEPCAFKSSQFYGSLTCEPGENDNLDERTILTHLYTDTEGNSWKNRNNWLEDNRSICDWHGVHCASEDNAGGETVTKLELPSNGLEGTIPGIIYHLPSLRVLNLRNNRIDMSFKGIGALSTLEELLLDSTDVSSLRNIGELNALRLLHIKDNSFGGVALSDDLYDLTTLERLDISNSGFAGSIASKIGLLTNLQQLYCHKNEISGVLPSALGQLTKLEVLSMSENYFFGTLPKQLNDMSSMRSLFIDSITRNTAGISGPLISFNNMPNLEDLYLASNSLTGSIPEDFLAGIRKTDATINVGLRENRLTGTVPVGLSRFDRLNIELADNKIEAIDENLCTEDLFMGGGVAKYGCAAILCPANTFNKDGRQTSDGNPCIPCSSDDSSPYLGATFCSGIQKQREKEILELLYRSTGGPTWKRNTGWLDDSVDICKWHGISCRNGLTVESILLGSNNLVGSPPPQIFELPHLKFLWLYSNPIQFSFDGIEKATNLISLLLDSTGLTSLDGIGKAESLTDVDVRFNALQGRLPSEIKKLRNLESFSCANNLLSGPVPTFANNLKLSTLRLQHNQFTGTVPTFEGLKSLTSLDLSENYLTGTIPARLLQAVNSETKVQLDLSQNAITGTIPSELSRFEQLTLYLRDNKIEAIHPQLCDKADWNGGDVSKFNCNGLLCKSGTYAPLTGRATKDGVQCQACADAQYFGSSVCSSASWMVLTTLATSITLLVSIYLF